jgi:hypothetical protein
MGRIFVDKSDGVVLIKERAVGPVSSSASGLNKNNSTSITAFRH